MALDLNKPVQTRDGRAVRILCRDRVGALSSVIGLVNEAGVEGVYSWDLAGRHYPGVSKFDSTDLINVPERLTGWVNLYPPSLAVGSSTFVAGTSHLHATREEADRHAERDRIGCVEINTERLP